MKWNLLFFIIVALRGSIAAANYPTEIDPQVPCKFCGNPVRLEIARRITDRDTEEIYYSCSQCYDLPRCWVCNLPVKKNDLKLPGNRHYCLRDAQTLVLDFQNAEKVCSQVACDLNILFSRFTSFPSPHEVSLFDKLTEPSLPEIKGDFTNLISRNDTMGIIRSKNNYSAKDEKQIRENRLNSGETYYEYIRLFDYKISLLTGQPLVQFKATCAHELAHAWVCENVLPAQKNGLNISLFSVCERRCQIREEAEEGFCELIAYLLMVSQHEEKQENVILENLYTHGQAALFIEAEKRYGLNDILDWIKYGETEYLEVGRLDKIRNVKIPAKKTVSAEYVAANKSADTNTTVSETNLPLSVLPAIKLQGIIWGTRPTAIINGRSFFANDQMAVKNGVSNVLIRCLEIKKSTVRIRHVDSNQEEELSL